MDCPICQYKGLEDDAVFCPSCKTDLSAFQGLNAIQASFKKQKLLSTIFIVLFVLAALACVLIYLLSPPSSSSKEAEQKLVQCESSMKTLQAENMQLKEKISLLEAKNEALTTEKEPTAPAKQKSITHVVVAGETLYLIASKYLGNGELYKKIAADNGIPDPNIIVPGQEITINK